MTHIISRKGKIVVETPIEGQADSLVSDIRTGRVSLEGQGCTTFDTIAQAKLNLAISAEELFGYATFATKRRGANLCVDHRSGEGGKSKKGNVYATTNHTASSGQPILSHDTYTH